MNTNDNGAPRDNENSGASNQADNNTPPSLEEQEQLNTSNLSQRINEENTPQADYSDHNEITEEPTQAEEDLTGFLDRNISEEEGSRSVGSDRPVNKNLAGDNPPGAEQAAFDTGNASAEAFESKSENTVDWFRENLDKTEDAINLDKKLKENSQDESDE